MIPATPDATGSETHSIPWQVSLSLVLLVPLYLFLWMILFPGIAQCLAACFYAAVHTDTLWVGLLAALVMLMSLIPLSINIAWTLGLWALFKGSRRGLITGLASLVVALCIFLCSADLLALDVRPSAGTVVFPQPGGSHPLFSSGRGLRKPVAFPRGPRVLRLARPAVVGNDQNRRCRRRRCIRRLPRRILPRRDGHPVVPHSRIMNSATCTQAAGIPRFPPRTLPQTTPVRPE